VNWFGDLHTVTAKPEFSPEDIALLNKLADKIVKRRMTIPAVMFFESIKPMNFVGAQAMIFIQPFVTALFTIPEYNRIREMLERRETLYKFVDILEHQEDEYLLVEKKELHDARKKKEAERVARGLPALPWWRRMFKRKPVSPQEPNDQ